MKFRALFLIVLAALLFLIISPGCLKYVRQSEFAYILNHNTKEETAPKAIQTAVLGTSVQNIRPAATPPAKQNATLNSSPTQTQPQPTKKVYLTFDDGPNPTNTPLVLDILDNYGIKATFFVVGTNVEKHPEILKDIVSRGHALGNHTYSHKYKELYASQGSFLKSIKANEELIARLVGQRPHIVRDPGGVGRNNTTLKSLLAQNGYRMVDWNVDSYDSRKLTSEGEDIIENIRRQAKNKNLWPDMIILMHDGTGHMNTVRALPTVIEMLKSEGFEFAKLE